MTRKTRFMMIVGYEGRVLKKITPVKCNSCMGLMVRRQPVKKPSYKKLLNTVCLPFMRIKLNHHTSLSFLDVIV